MTVNQAEKIGIAAAVRTFMVVGELDNFLAEAGFDAAAMLKDSKQQRVYIVSMLDYILRTHSLLQIMETKEGFTVDDLKEARAVLEGVLERWQ